MPDPMPAIRGRLTRLALRLAFALALPVAGAGAQPAPTPAILADLDRYIAAGLADWHGAGIAVGIVKDDSLIYARGFGVREVGKPEPVDDRTVFAIASNTKFFTAVAAAMLADDGRLSLDDPITKHLPWFQVADPWVTRELTLRDVLSHRSGLRGSDLLWFGTPFSRDEVVRRLRSLTPSAPFRNTFTYSNIMFLVAGQALAAAAGTSWDEVVRTRIFGPLGMTASLTDPAQLARASNVAQPHVLAATATTPARIPLYEGTNAAPAGSIHSTVQDMARWMRFILNGGRAGGRQLLAPATLADLTAPHNITRRAGTDTLNPSNHFQLYGLGIGLSDLMGVKVLSHTGGVDGFTSYVAMVPERRLGIVVLTNTAGHNGLYSAVGERALNAFLGGPTRDWSALALTRTRRTEQAAAGRQQALLARRAAGSPPARPLAEYAGTYRHEMFGDLSIALENGALVLRYPTTLVLALEPFDGDVFLSTSSSPFMLVKGPDTVRFGRDAMARLASVTLDGMGTFARVATR